jgi:hypothetical protein
MDAVAGVNIDPFLRIQVNLPFTFVKIYRKMEGYMVYDCIVTSPRVDDLNRNLSENWYHYHNHYLNPDLNLNQNRTFPIMNRYLTILFIALMLLFAACGSRSDAPADRQNGQDESETFAVTDSVTVEMEILMEEIEQAAGELDELLDEIDAGGTP